MRYEKIDPKLLVRCQKLFLRIIGNPYSHFHFALCRGA